MSNNTLILLFICFAICSDISINGYIYDEDKVPIYNAEVYLKDISTGTTSDSLGYFNLFVPPKDIYEISLSHVAYKNKVVKVKSADSKNLLFIMSKDSYSIDDIVVTSFGYSSHIKDTPIITQIITSNDIENSSYTSFEDIIQFAIPNVQWVHDPHGTNRVKIQGLENSFTVFMIDGKRISAEYAGNIDFSIVSLSDIERIEFVKSGMSTIYGSDAVGGIINIITKKYIDPFHLSISYVNDLPSIHSSSVDCGINRGPFHLKIHADYNHSPGYDLTDYSPLSKTSEEQSFAKLNTSIQYVKENLKIDYTNRLYRKSVNRYNSIFNTSTLEWDTTLYQQNPRYYDYSNSLNINYLINENVDSDIQISHELYNKSYYFPYYYSNYPNPVGEIKKSALPTRMDVLYTIRTSIKNHTIHTGFEYVRESYQSFDIIGSDGVSLEDESVFIDERDRKLNEYSFFITDKFSLNRFEFMLGNRITKYSSYDWTLVPSASVRFNTDLFNFRVNYSRGYRVPSIKELYYDFQSHPPPIYGNPDLRPSQSSYSSISVESRKLQNSYIEVYRNNVVDMISYNSYDDGIYYVNGDQIILYGLNLSLKKKLIEPLTLEFLYSFTDGMSDSDYLLEGISNHGFNSKIICKIHNNLTIVYKSQFTSSKSVILFGSGDKRDLESHNISDFIINTGYKKAKIKLGVKNIFNYLDSSRMDSSSKEYLSSIDPGRRLYMNIAIDF